MEGQEGEERKEKEEKVGDEVVRDHDEATQGSVDDDNGGAVVT